MSISRIDIVRFNTFNSEWNQGEVVWLADKPIVITKAVRTLSQSNGCVSAELVSKTVEMVVLEGRVFVLDPTSFWEKGMPHYTVTLPYGFRPKLLYPGPCPFCGK